MREQGVMSKKRKFQCNTVFLIINYSDVIYSSIVCTTWCLPTSKIITLMIADKNVPEIVRLNLHDGWKCQLLAVVQNKRWRAMHMKVRGETGFGGYKLASLVRGITCSRQKLIMLTFSILWTCAVLLKLQLQELFPIISMCLMDVIIINRSMCPTECIAS